MNRREGSALTGVKVVWLKEMQDYAGNIRMIVLMGLIILTAGASMYVAAQTLRSYVGEDSFMLLNLFTISQGPIPSFLSFVSFLVPLTGIALGFDAVNCEYQNRTLGRILSKPIYRDALLFGKVLGAISSMAVVLLALWLLVIGSAMLFLGVPPSTEQIARAFTFYIITVFYATVWYLTGMLFSIVFRQSAVSALVALALWLFFMIFWPMISQLLSYGLGRDSFHAAQLEVVLGRVSPYTLFNESAVAILHPSTRSLSVVLFSQLQGAVMGSALPFAQSLLLIWPHITAFLSIIIILFVLSYILFQRKEVRM